MDCKVSPLLAIVRVYSFEKRVLFANANYISIPHGRYVDDAYTLVSSRRDAEILFNRLAAQDPDNKLAWEIEFPDEDNAQSFIPFLGNQIKISDGAVMSKFYRKPQKKNIVLHARSHHCLKTKVETAKNFYYTAENCSTSPEFVEESLQVVDKLLRCNVYKNPRDLRTSKQGVSLGYKDKGHTLVHLKLPCMSEAISKQVIKFVRKHKLPVKVIFTPGRKLRDIFCSSRPYYWSSQHNFCMHFLVDSSSQRILGILMVKNRSGLVLKFENVANTDFLATSFFGASDRGNIGYIPILSLYNHVWCLNRGW